MVGYKSLVNNVKISHPPLSFPRRRESSHLARIEEYSVSVIYGNGDMGGFYFFSAWFLWMLAPTRE